jgi:hypothetical protein
MRRTLRVVLSVIAIAAAGCSSGSGEDLPSGLVVRRLPPAPVDRRESVVACVTGTQLSVWQLNNARASGALLDRASQSWRPLPKPFQRAFGRAACQDTGLYWFGSRGALANPGQVFELGERRWRPLPASPLDDALGTVAVAVGSDFFAIGHVAGTNVGAIYDHSERRWSTVSLPRPLRTLTYPPTLVATGHDVVALRPLDDASGRAVTLRYDVAQRRWATLAVSPHLPVAGVQYVATDRDLIVFGEPPRTGPESRREPAHLSGARLDLATGAWRAMADPPDIGYADDEDVSRADTLQAAWTGSALMVWTGSQTAGAAPNTGVPVLAYSPASDQWATLGTVNAKRRCTLPQGQAVWTGHEMVIFCSDGIIGLRPEHT